MTTQKQGPRTVYLLLTRSETYFSRLIHLFTQGEFTHASIGLEGPTGAFYSFARKYPRLPFPGGLIREQVDRGFFSLHPHIPCCLYALTVSEDTYQSICRRVRMMYENRERYHYNMLGAMASYFKLPLVRRNHKFCSEFVAEVLYESGAVELERDPALTHPMDFCRIQGLRPILRGEVGSMAGGAA